LHKADVGDVEYGERGVSMAFATVGAVGGMWCWKKSVGGRFVGEVDVQAVEVKGEAAGG
jgi:hypothetical protein